MADPASAGRLDCPPTPERGAICTDALIRQGLALDLSVRPLFSYAAEGGPDFTDFDSRLWAGPVRGAAGHQPDRTLAALAEFWRWWDAMFTFLAREGGERLSTDALVALVRGRDGI
ncbi:hypothetical protein ACMT1E_06770 [Sphingomonas flavalba]|uniref:hypothetical protein n=1 Tax=Sphingomonas flavalba TaxID=2559804 RepID=UPI0039E03C05